MRYRRPAENPPNTLWEMQRSIPVNWSAGGMCQPPEPTQTHLPHEHEEEASRGHESSPARRRQHPKHGHNCGGRGGRRKSRWLIIMAPAPNPHPGLADILGIWGKIRHLSPSQQYTPFLSAGEGWILAGVRRGAADGWSHLNCSFQPTEHFQPT